VSRKEFENPVEQVMFILGFKHDPKFASSLDAIQAGSNPGVLNALEQVAVYGRLKPISTECARRWREYRSISVPILRRQRGSPFMRSSSKSWAYGGKWFSSVEEPPEHWINLEAYSPVFRRGRTRTFFRRKGIEVFCLPTPYFRLLSDVFNH
jgi:hypothetical protein